MYMSFFHLFRFGKKNKKNRHKSMKNLEHFSSYQFFVKNKSFFIGFSNFFHCIKLKPDFLFKKIQ